LNTEDLLKFILGIADKFNALDTKVLYLGKVCDFTDYFVIASGTSATHIQSLCEELIYQCKHAGRPAASIEGLAGAEWCLLDFGDIVVHVFQPEKRAHYNLEGLWRGAEEVPVETTPA